MRIQAERYHDFSAGHKVTNHESKCAHLHGHNYRVHFTIEGDQDSIGRVLDFSVIKSLLAEWLEENWDHKFLIWNGDSMAAMLSGIDPPGVVLVDFNPTAENMAKHLIQVVAPEQLRDTGCRLVKVKIEETRKCSAVIYE